MKQYLIAYKLISAFDMNPITSRVLEFEDTPTKKQIEAEIGKNIKILAVSELPSNWETLDEYETNIFL